MNNVLNISFLCAVLISNNVIKNTELNGLIGKQLPIIYQMYCLLHQNFYILLGYVLSSNRRDTAI